MLNLRHLPRIAARNALDRTSSFPNELELASDDLDSNPPLDQLSTGRVIGLVSRFIYPIPVLSTRLISRNSLDRHPTRPSTGSKSQAFRENELFANSETVLASTLSLAIGQPSQQLDPTARLSADLLST